MKDSDRKFLQEHGVTLDAFSMDRMRGARVYLIGDVNFLVDSIRKEYEGRPKMGVGDGTGNMFVQGDFESIKACQQKLLDLEKYRVLFEAAMDFINKHPADPDITEEQTLAWINLQNKLNKYGE